MKPVWIIIYVLLVGILLCFTGCSTPNEDDYKHRFEVIRLDGCEYYYNGSTYGPSLCHKGNCTNSIHAYREQK